jgi:tRNA-specific 2-thiouridylase
MSRRSVPAPPVESSRSCPVTFSGREPLSDPAARPAGSPALPDTDRQGLVAVAMSGGLDSSVTAWLLASSGRPVVGLSMLLWDQSQQARHGRCCSALDLRDAQRVAHQAGIPHYTLRLDEDFRRQVVDPFVADYLAGRTPSPCVRCNTFVKFDLFLARSRELGAARMATGHYARVVATPEGYQLHVARDREKDQSYYLFELDQEQLAAVEFPLGEHTKEEVRALAREVGLAVAEKGESMEVCFVSDGIREFVEAEAERHLAAPLPGARLVASDGRTLGVGEPYYRYTVGQRRGLGIAAPERLYVLGVDPARNEVRVGVGGELDAGGLTGERLHWIAGHAPADEDGAIRATVRIRARHPGVAATIHPAAEGRVEVHFATPQRGVAPGQAAVFYRGTQVLGGCWITGPRPVAG